MRAIKVLLLRIIRICCSCKRFAGVILDPMYICICNAIREADLRQAALKSGGDATATYASLGKKPNCGQCLVKAGQIIDQERAIPSCENVAV